MTLTEMLVLVRRDLWDEVVPYLWSDNQLTRHINRALKEFSERLPLLAKATIATTPGSREIDISALTDRVMLQAVEYPVDEFPQLFQRFSVWGNTLTIISGDMPNGGNCYIYYGRIHTLDAVSSTIPAKYEDLVATGAAGYAAFTLGVYSINKVNVGGTLTPRDYMTWGKDRLKIFNDALKRLGRAQRVRPSQLFES